MESNGSAPLEGTDGGRTDPDDRHRSYCELGEAIDALERVDWSEVPTFSTSEAAALHARLREARDELAVSVSPAPGRGRPL